MSKGLNEIKTKLVENFIDGEIPSKPYIDLQYQREYVSDYNMNLYQKMPSTIVKQFEKGSGDELHDTTKRPAKMKAKYSSSAFAVNLFGYDKLKIITNSYGIPEGEYDVEYEKKLKAITYGQPNVDVVLSSKKCLVYIETKLTEPIDYAYNPTDQDNIDALQSYTTCSRYIVDKNYELFKNVFNEIHKDCPKQYDAMQMLKHLLGICNTMEECKGKKVFLINCHCANAILDDANSDFQVMGDNYIKNVAKICDACGVKVMNLNHKEMMAIMDMEEGRRKYVEARYNLE